MLKPTGTVIPFPRERCRPTKSGVRVARIADRWCVERLEAGDVTALYPAASPTDALRIANRISRRDKVKLLQPCLTSRSGYPRPGGDAA